MLQQLKNGGQRQIGGAPRESYTGHPLFGDKMMHELNREDVKFPPLEIPINFKAWVLSALVDIPFPNLHMAVGTYWKLINQQPEEWTFGVLQKAADIVWNSKVEKHKRGYDHTNVYPMDQEALQYHYNKAIAINKMRTTIEGIISPIREKVIDELIEFTKQEKKKAQAKASLIV